jgi:hypothetical protein
MIRPSVLVGIKELSEDTKCHSEPFASLKDRLREESPFPLSQTLGFAQSLL